MFRVSEVLEFYKDFSAIPKDILEAKALIGSNVHACIKAHYEGIPLFPEGREEGYFESYLKWQNDHNCVPSHLESRYYGKGYYDSLTGQIDAVMPLKTSSVLVDFKTSNQPDHLCWALQAYYYHRLLLDNQIMVDPHVLFVQLEKDGNAPKLHWYDTSCPTTTEIAMATWTVFKVKKGLIKIRK